MSTNDMRPVMPPPDGLRCNERWAWFVRCALLEGHEGNHRSTTRLERRNVRRHRRQA